MDDNNYNNTNQGGGTPNTPPNSDPYKTTSGNWQPPQQPSTGWSPNTGRADYSSNYQNTAYGPNKQQEEYKWNFNEYDSTAAAKPEGKKKHKGLRVFTTIICSMLAITVVGFAGYGIYSIAIGGTGSNPQSQGQLPADDGIKTPALDITEVPSEPESISSDGKLTTAQIAAKVQPSVVGVVAYVGTEQSLYGSGIMQSSEGSGIIMSADGYIITNAHVVDGASGMKIVLNNGEEYDAKLIGMDKNTDLAVVKIEADNLTPAEFGDSAQLQVGEDVVAIGNPGGLQLAGSVTKGVVSGVNRPIKSDDVGYTMNCIQTDAAINPGNSGGALVNQHGQVVGINSSKIADTAFEGLGFAIPISEAKPIVDDLIANGRVTGRVQLGVRGVTVDEVLARYNNVPVGFMIMEIEAGSDIATKGVVAGDIITKVDGNDIASSGDIADYLRNFKPGDKVTLTIFRRTSGKRDATFEVSIELVENQGDDAAAAQAPVEPVPQQPDATQGYNFFSFFQ